MSASTKAALRINKAEQVRREAKARILESVKPGDTIHTILRHVSASGMSRDISLFIVRKNGEIDSLTYWAARLMGYRFVSRNGHDAIRVGGCGMDMGFHVVHRLGEEVFGFGEECAALGYHKGRNGDTGPETDGGYLLNQRWL